MRRRPYAWHTVACSVLCSVVLAGCNPTGISTEPPDSDDTTDVPAGGDFVIDGETREFVDETLDLRGNLILKNGGELILNRTILNVISSFDEEFTIQVSGDSRLEANDAVIQGQEHQTAIIAEPDNGASPTMLFNNTTVTFHAGIRPYGDSRVTATNSNIEEIQVHDRAVVTVTGGEGIYPVFFFDGQSAELVGLTVAGPVTRTVDVPGGWSFSLEGTEVNGYQIDVEGDATVTLTDCDAVTASVHTPGTLGSEEVIVRDVTTVGRASGEITGLGPEIAYENTAIDLFNIYLTDTDLVRIVGGVVNEANTEGESRLVIQQCGLEYNLVQAYEQSTIIIEDCTMAADESVQPSLTATDDGTIVVRRSDVTRLDIQAIDNGHIELESVEGLDADRLSTQDQGTITVDGGE